MATFSADEIPNRFDYSDAHDRIYQMWEQGGYFHAEPDSAREPYTIVIPPPNVTGALHLGHALNNTLQDILIRMKRMQGYNALWMPGTDHAGIATQAVVEKRIFAEEGKTRHDLGREELVSRIWDWKGQYEKRIINQLKGIGCSCDWQRARFTLDTTCARAVRETFFDLFGKQLIYRGKRLVNWDTHLQTAVSNDEVYHDKTPGHFWHFRYPVIDPQAGEPTHVVIATTRPETMLGDTAVAVHPDPTAALDKHEQQLRENLAAASDKDRPLLEEQLERLANRRRDVLPQLIQLRDMAQDGRMLNLPLLNREIPLIVDEWAKPELGSGCVKITPAHDPNDYEVGRRQSLPMINILATNGTLNPEAGPYAGLKIAEARRKVVADLTGLELMDNIEDREIDLAYSDRSKTPIEPLLADQWFVKMEQLAQSAMDAVSDERVKIFPTRYRKSYLDWLSEKRDWPISRQLWWGHQIPIWSRTCASEADYQQTLEILDADEMIHSREASYQVELAEENENIEGTQEGVYCTIHVCVRQENEQLEKTWTDRGFVREQDVLDTWFSSALWPHSTLGWPESNADLEYFYPTSTLITSRDIITLWVARMVLAGLNNMNEIPFREVYIHPKILDGDGEGMSKSKGNGVDPMNVIQKFGADALRFGLAYLTTETQDVRMPVQFECPHCQKSVDQNRKNRELPRIDCPHCKEAFKTQWAIKDEDKALTEAAVLSERFENSRNFCNKLWNAARFTMLNLEDYSAAPVTDAELAFEDRWMLSRLASVTAETTRYLDSYHYAEGARCLYGFAWDEFCSFYVEMTKTRLDRPKERAVAQRVIAHVLDSLLRLLHPMIPFITEEIWQLLGRIAPKRGLREIGVVADHIVGAKWPTACEQDLDPDIEQQFSSFQEVLRGVREIRSRQNLPPRKEIRFVVRCDEQAADRLRPMAAFFEHMAKATCDGWGAPDVPTVNAAMQLDGNIELFVNLDGLIDVEAEKARNKKNLSRITGQIEGKRRKLQNANFVDRAPADVVQGERESLAELEEQAALIEQALKTLSDV